MSKVLGKKQSIKNTDWMEAIKNIESVVEKKDLDKRIRETVKAIKKETSGKRAAYAWSGGKDSIVLGAVCEMAGIKDCVLVVCDLEYKDFMEWVERNKPEKLVIENTGQNLEWLATHPNMLFPQDSKTAAQWFHIVQHRGQARYYKENNLDILLLGRRRADGNYVGKYTRTDRGLHVTVRWQTGAMKKFWHLSIITMQKYHLFIHGTMVICAVHILGRQGNGQDPLKMDGKKCMR